VTQPSLDHLNALPADSAEDELLVVCGARAWARSVASRRPFRDSAALLDAAEAAWDALTRDDWQETFAAHPRIGKSRTAAGADASAWSREEQARALESSGSTSELLADAQRRYEERFGHVFLICATGRSAEEILEVCSARLAHDPEVELPIACKEERKIGRLRLDRLLTEQR
jgi:OHCU decarboxylase